MEDSCFRGPPPAPWSPAKAGVVGPSTGLRPGLEGGSRPRALAHRLFPAWMGALGGLRACRRRVCGHRPGQGAVLCWGLQGPWEDGLVQG